MQRTALPQLWEPLAGHELTIWAAAPIVVLVGLAFALLSGSAIARLAGASATIATLGLLIIVHVVAVGARELTRGSQTFFGVPRVTDIALSLGVALAFIVIARLFRESPWGIAARAVRDDPAAAEALGINPQRTRMIAWCVSGMMATIAGMLYGHMLGAFSPASFYLALVFAQVAMLIVGGMTTVSGAVVGVLAVTLLQDSVRQAEGGFVLFGFDIPPVFGLTTVALGVAILLIIWRRPQGIVGQSELGPSPASSLFNRLGKETKAADAPRKAKDACLSSDNLSKSFAGVVAVSNVSFNAPTGQITGLIGPNGAGKSTLVNLLTRAYDADSGSASFAEADLLSAQRDGIARLGVARTFQNLRLFGGLSTYEKCLDSGPCGRAF